MARSGRFPAIRSHFKGHTEDGSFDRSKGDRLRSQGAAYRPSIEAQRPHTPNKQTGTYDANETQERFLAAASL
jgi:hypothetical protein